MNTYAEAKARPPFDWNAFLATEQSGTEWGIAANLASSWVTCACGNQCAALPRDSGGQPKDMVLRRLGMKFMKAIDSAERDKARFVLAEIEARSAVLLAAQP